MESLSAQSVPEDVEVAVIVVDNGPSQDVFRHPSPPAAGNLKVTVLAETRPGIPFARNALVRAALADGSDYVLFVDDDEVVEHDWLAHHLRTVDDRQADVVAGPVLPTLPAGAPRWAACSGVFERPRFETGKVLPWAATGNTLVSTAVFERVSPWFEDRFARTGGSDWEFFRRVAAEGFTIVWCDEAVAHELLSLDRVTPRWFVRRCLRTGSVRGLETRRAGSAEVTSGMISGPRAAAVVAAATLLTILEAPRGWRALRRARQALFHVGVLLGLLGRAVPEYTTVRRTTDPLA